MINIASGCLFSFSFFFSAGDPLNHVLTRTVRTRYSRCYPKSANTRQPTFIFQPSRGTLVAWRPEMHLDLLVTNGQLTDQTLQYPFETRPVAISESRVAMIVVIKKSCAPDGFLAVSTYSLSFFIPSFDLAPALHYS